MRGMAPLSLPTFLRRRSDAPRIASSDETVRREPSSRATSPADALPSAPNLALSHVLALQARVPQLAELGLQATSENADALMRFCNAFIPLVVPEARGAHLRTLLARLRDEAPELAPHIKSLIARSDLANGMPDRAQALSTEADVASFLREQTEHLEDAYGAKHITLNWQNPSRGAALKHYLSAHPHLFSEKDVLHIAPEAEVREWLASRCRYHVLDGSPDSGTDIAADITSIPIPDATYDLVLCHRVLEHVVDDVAAMREMHRILRPGGVLNLSVPQAAHLDRTSEWLVQDESHHMHVRHYGLDIADRLASAGFSHVSVVDWLLRRPAEELLALGAYPMRMYEAV